VSVLQGRDTSDDGLRASESLASIEILHERLALKEEQIDWKGEQLAEVREEISTLREERKLFTRALTQAFETIQGLNSQLMTLAAPADRGAIARGGPSRASVSASEDHLDAEENASEVIHVSSDPASENGESLLATP
jgi:chromosome segregation ATPase